MISSYRRSQSTTRGIILHIIIVPHQRCLNCWMLPRHICSIQHNLQHQGNSRNELLLSIFFTRIRSTEDHQQIVLYSFCRSMRLLFIWQLKYYFQIFLAEDLSTLTPYIHLSVVFPSRMPTRTALFVTQPILLSENIPNIWHKSSTKHKEVKPDWNDKNDNANYMPSCHMEGFTNGSGCHFWKYSIRSAKRFRLWIVLFWTKTSQHLTLYLLSSLQIIFTSC